MNGAQLNLGQIITGDEQRDAIHIAVAPVVADELLRPGQPIAFIEGSTERVRNFGTSIGIVDPFLSAPVESGQRFWMFLYPNTITSLRHDWTHHAFIAAEKSSSEKWMRKWAMRHVSADYYSDDENAMLSEDAAFAYAIEAGHSQNIGPHEDARDYIDAEWWTHWEAITGVPGKRDEFFSCSS